MPPSPHDHGQRSPSGNALRDSMLKSQEDAIQRPRGPAGPARDEDAPRLPSSPFHGWSPFPRVRNQTDVLLLSPWHQRDSSLCVLSLSTRYGVFSLVLCSSMTSGRRGQREGQRGVRKTAVTHISNRPFFYTRVYIYSGAGIETAVCIPLFRSGFCGFLRRPG